jgi:hypothetical protein
MISSTCYFISTCGVTRILGITYNQNNKKQEPHIRGMSAPPHQTLNNSLREFTPNIRSSPTINASNKHHLPNNLVRHSSQANITRTPHFEGQFEELKIYVYDTTDIRQAD